MKDIIRMNQLAGIITEGQARKMMQILKEENGTKSLEDFVEEYITDINEFMNDDWFIDNGNVMFTIPYTENYSSEDPAMPSEDVTGLKNILQQKGIKILKKGIMNDGGYKYTVIKVNYDDLKSKLNA
jgi:hypothetical protein